MSRPFETVERAGERKPSYFERGLFRARNLDELVMEFMDPAVDAEKSEEIQRVVEGIIDQKPLTRDEEKANVQKVIEALDVRGLVPEGFFEADKRKFRMVRQPVAFKDQEQLRDPLREMKDVAVYPTWRQLVNRSALGESSGDRVSLDSPTLSYVSGQSSATPDTVGAVSIVALLHKEMMTVEDQIGEANRLAASIHDWHGRTDLVTRVAPGNEPEWKPYETRSSTFSKTQKTEGGEFVPEWLFVDEYRGKDVNLQNGWANVISDGWERRLSHDLQGRSVDASFFQIFNFSYDEYSMHPVSRWFGLVDKGVSRDLSIVIYWADYLSVMGKFVYCQKKLEEENAKEKPDLDVQEGLTLYRKLYGVLKDIMEAGFTPVRLGPRPIILLLTDAPSWRETLEKWLKNQPSFQFEARAGASVREIMDALADVGFRPPAASELASLLGPGRRK